MAGKRLTKQQMREDQFRDALEEIIFGFMESVEKHTKAYLIGLLVLIIAVGGTLAFLQVRKGRLDKGSYRLSRVMEAYNTPVVKDDSQIKPGEETFASQAEKYEAIKERIAELEAVKGSGKNLKWGIYYKALLQADKGKLDEAIKTIGPLTDDSKLAPVALSTRARLYEASGKTKEAGKDWSTLASGSHEGIPPGEGWWLLGSFYERTGQNDKAIEAYSKIKSDNKDNNVNPGMGQTLAARAKRRLKALKGEV